MTNINKKYSIGIDIGSSSVGYCVVDDDYNILKFKNKNMWGVRLFKEGETAANRRISRTTRRRMQRKKERIALLKQCIGEIVLDKDESFFMRMEKGFMNKADKGYEFNLFNDDNYTDKQFFEKYPTIYHLRKHLFTTNDKADPRFIYLALHHIFKYRGNFLYEGQKFEISNNDQVHDNLADALKMLFEDYDIIEENIDEITNNVLNILCDTKMKKGEKKDKIIQLFVGFDKDTKKISTECISLIVGDNSNISKLFPKMNVQKDDKDYKVNFGTTEYEDENDFIEESLQDYFECIENLHNVYSFILLKDILSGHSYICDAMIYLYEKHKKDLEKLKLCIKTYGTVEMYNKIFHSKKTKGNYCQYISEPKTTPKKDFYDFLKKVLETNEKVKQSKEYFEILEDINNDNFLPKQKSTDNGAIPYQMHEMELIKILDNQAKFYPLLGSQKDRLIDLFKFRVPYYVGPLNTHSEFHWVSRNENVKLTPWNFNEEVNLLESAENFIRRMTNCCTYLLTEPVVPKKSLLYTKYEVLNELNKIRINGKLIPTDIKKMVLNEVFLSRKKVKKKDIEDFYIRKQLSDGKEPFEIVGFQKENEFASSLDSWIDFIGIYKDFYDHIDEIETIIEWITVYEDKKILKERIKKEFPGVANDKGKMKKILNLKYKGWGRLSRTLLTEIKVLDNANSFVSIMNCLEDTQMNFMQIINDKSWGFKEKIAQYGFEESHDKINYNQVAMLQGSPAIKKGIWQTVEIVDELVHIMGCEPEQIYLEFARSDEEKKRTQSKVKRLQDIYSLQVKNKYKDNDFSVALKELKTLDKNNKLDDDRLTLYFIQQGKCMYSGKSLDISKLHLYQIDHILPQSFIKDDSIENKALVMSNENQYKSDNLLIASDIRKRQYTWWEYLLKNKLIGEKKFRNLTRSYISEKEEIGFINRQLVETRQITKHVANLFKTVYQNTNIVSIKASLSSEFRNKFDLYKVREINDYHHAQDAYLASVIGTFVLRKYSSLKNDFIFTEYNQLNNYKKDLKQMNDTKQKYGFVLNSMNDKININSETGEVVWEGNKTIAKIRKVFNYKDCFITKKTEEGKGQLFNLTIEKNSELVEKVENTPHKIVPLNKQRADVEKYGGFTSFKYAYGIAVEYQVKNKTKREVLDVPRILANAPQDKVIDYLLKETGADNITVIKDKLLYNQLFEYKGGLYTMASASEWSNARQLILSNDSQKTLYYLFNEKLPNPTDEAIVNVYDEYLEKLKKYYPYLKEVCCKLEQQRDNFIALDSKTKIVKELLKMTKANPENGNLIDGDFKLSARAGRITGKTIKLEEAVFVSQSITGLFEQTYKL